MREFGSVTRLHYINNLLDEVKLSDRLSLGLESRYRISAGAAAAVPAAAAVSRCPLPEENTPPPPRSRVCGN